jgi:negative regulator of flagellin synthesis FlgM
MDIKNVQSTLLNSRLNDTSRYAEKNTAQQTTSESQNKPQADRVTLTSTSSQIRELEKRASNATPGNEARIAELKRSISEGSYNVNANSVAEKLLNMEKMFARV